MSRRKGRGRPRDPADEFAKAVYGEHLAEYNSVTRTATVKGVGKVYMMRPNSDVTMRHKLIADLHSVGLTVREASSTVTGCKPTSAGYYGKVLKNPKIQARMEETLKDTVGRAKEILMSTVVKAAENVKEAVDKGDYKASKDVLLSTNLMNNGTSNVNSEVKVSFGQWLAAQATKTIDAVEVPQIEAPKAVEAEYEEEEQLEGVRLRH